MKIKNVILILMTIVALPATAQIFNFSLRTNNQQLIDEALSRAFVRINQSYELCDTVKDEHFGRDGKDYFSIVPFIGIETERGLIFPSATLKPWSYDNDFNEYKSQYKPLVTGSKLDILNNKDLVVRNVKEPFAGNNISKYLCALNDTTQNNQGLKVDSVPGLKKGWLIWLSLNSNLAESDSVRFTSIKKDIEVPIDGGFLHIDKPEISETVYGGIYVTPIQSAIGQITFTLTGVMVLDDEGWVIDFPFVKEPEEKKVLTPINGIAGGNKLNPLKKKRK